MKYVAFVIALAFGACVEPSNENVNPEGPTTTTTIPEPSESTTTTAGQPVEVARWKGTADTDTENFTVKESWELHWKVTAGPNGVGAGVGVDWVDPTDQFAGDSISLEPGEGSSLIREGGTFYMEISTFGSGYELWVVDVPN